MDRIERKLEYVASSLKDLESMPFDVKEAFVHVLRLALLGEKHPDAEPMKGFKGGSVLEVRKGSKSGTYRAMYTIKFEKAVYVLHVFKKKSKSGIKTPKQDIDLIHSRLKMAEIQYKIKYLKNK